MTRSLTFGLAVVLLALGAAAQEKASSITGWFSDEGCAKGRVNNGMIGPTNPDCAKKCIDSGAPAVFISEQEKAIFRVKNYPSVKDDIGYHLEIDGTLDKAAGTITVKSVKRISEYEGPSCARRPMKSTEKK